VARSSSAKEPETDQTGWREMTDDLGTPSAITLMTYQLELELELIFDVDQLALLQTCEKKPQSVCGQVPNWGKETRK